MLQPALGLTRGGIALLAQTHGDMAVLLREAEIAIGEAGVADEFLKGAPFMALPIRVIEILVEHQHRARLQARREHAQHRHRRGIDVAIDMQESDAVIGMRGEESRQRLLEPALMQRDIARHLRQGAAAAEFALLLEGAGPGFGQPLETVEAVEAPHAVAREMAQARAIGDAAFDHQPVGRRLAHRMAQQRPAILEDRRIAHLGDDVIDASLACAELQLGDEVAAVIFEEETAVEPLRKRHRPDIAAFAAEQTHFFSPSPFAVATFR